ncbi:MAG: SEL1-like repeat protein [Alphaproteobacteria bacterium]|nr:SEL1-like repeat protein [Alphaproteobacteria bacterium]
MRGLVGAVWGLMLAAGFAAAPAVAAEHQMATSKIKQGDFAAAHRLLAPLVEAGDAEAIYLLGTLHANGEGVPTDLGRARELFQAAADKGHLGAQQQLQAMRQLGLITPPGGAAPGGWRVQLATVLHETAGEAEWRRLRRLYREELAALSLSVLPFNSAAGDTLYRIQAGPLTEGAARALCQTLKERQQTCRLIRPSE